jgi:beta-glucosidase
MNSKQRRLSDKAARKKDIDDLVEQWMNHLSLAEKVGQMSQIDLPMLLRDDGPRKVIDPDKVRYWIGERGVGSVLNTAPGVAWNVTDYREAIDVIQQVSTSEYHRPFCLYGLDSVHGANYVQGAIWTPQPINLAATFNASWSYLAGKLAARDTMAAGIPWLFSPLLGLSLSPRWPRVYETFGEDPHLVGIMARAMIEGIQSTNYGGNKIRDRDIGGGPPTYGHIPFTTSASACAKHFIGYSLPRTGHDRAPSWIPKRHLYQYFVPPWIKAMSTVNTSSRSLSDGGDDEENYRQVDTVMESYTETDGVPNVANREMTRYLLRQRLGFKGVLVTDYNEIRNLYEWHHIVDNYLDATVHALRESSIDMSMIPYEVDDFTVSILGEQGKRNGAIHTHDLSEERINESVRRLLYLKARLQLLPPVAKTALNNSLGGLHDDPRIKLVGTDQEMVREMTAQSLILVENKNNTLPILSSRLPNDGSSMNENSTQPDRIKIFLTGPGANSLRVQTGGWSGQW